MQKRRTDLAVEARDLWTEAAGKAAKLEGVKSWDALREGYPVTTVEILDENGAKTLEKPVGTYVTISLGGLRRREEDAFGRAARVIAKELGQLLPSEAGGPVLVAGLGNQAITPDAIGPLVVSHILATRHLVKQMPEQFGAFRPVAAIAAGVLGTMGVESGEIIKEEYPRIYAVLKALDGDAHPWVKDFRDHTLYSTETALPGEATSDDDNGEDSTIFDSNYGLFYYYLGENTAEYLAHCNQNFEDIKDVDQLKKTLSSMIRSFNKSSVQEIVNIIDREVFEYRQRLIEEQKRTSLF